MQITGLLAAFTALLVAVQAQQIDTADEAAFQNTTLSKKLVARLGTNDGSSPANARDIQLDCSSSPDTCDADAYAMLCLGAPRVLRRNSANKSKHYRKSGAKCQPFRNSARYGTRTPFNDWVSPEEFPFESCDVENESQRTVFLFPVPQTQQSAQGGKLNADFARWHVGPNDWFHITRMNGCNRPYVLAFNSNDISICRKKFKPGQLDFAQYVWKKVSQPHKAIRFSAVGIVKRDVTGNETSIEEANVPLALPDGEDPWYITEEWEDDGLSPRDAVCTDD